MAIQYPDFAEWQRSWLSGDRLDEQLRYWPRLAVAGRDERLGGRRLIAWVVLEPAASLAGLRDQLRERLPASMVRSVFVEIEKLPLNASGKVDRRALPR